MFESRVPLGPLHPLRLAVYNVSGVVPDVKLAWLLKDVASLVSRDSCPPKSFMVAIGMTAEQSSVTPSKLLEAHRGGVAQVVRATVS